MKSHYKMLVSLSLKQVHRLCKAVAVYHHPTVQHISHNTEARITSLTIPIISHNFPWFRDVLLLLLMKL